MIPTPNPSVIRGALHVLIEDWRIDYNISRPHTAHGDLSPTEFAAAWAIKNQPKLRNNWATHRVPPKVDR
jgi:hypothetical protein